MAVMQSSSCRKMECQKSEKLCSPNPDSSLRHSEPIVDGMEGL